MAIVMSGTLVDVYMRCAHHFKCRRMAADESQLANNNEINGLEPNDKQSFYQFSIASKNFKIKAITLTNC
jgi:hypothetical protein